jgi:formate hydrogenlyase subunit 3/multisubunit Na+/H+ antiporter MnhD subunit
VLVAANPHPLIYLLGGWAPPLGVALRADGLSVTMMIAAAVVICAITVFARSDFRTPKEAIEGRAPLAFWILLLAIWCSLNAIFLAGDLFTLYVALELVTFAAVPLVCLDGRAETLQSALRYLLFALLGSVLYLVGTALLYGAHGTLDIVLLSQRVRMESATLVAAALMTVGLLAKTALFPLYLWLPPAHAGAPAAGSAVLSALVVKGSFFIIVRLWFDVMPGLPGYTAAQLLGGLGAVAIVLGSIVALRQERLKLLIAYSTLAQIGYLFLIFPLSVGIGSTRLERGGALAGGLLQAISHASAKAAMFMSAGLIYAALGRDRIAGLGGTARALPASVLAFAVGGLALVGLPGSGAYLAKDLLLDAAAPGRTNGGGRSSSRPAGLSRPPICYWCSRARSHRPASRSYCTLAHRSSARARRWCSHCARCCWALFVGTITFRFRSAPYRARCPSRCSRRCCCRSWAAPHWQLCWGDGSTGLTTHFFFGFTKKQGGAASRHHRKRAAPGSTDRPRIKSGPVRPSGDRDDTSKFLSCRAVSSSIISSAASAAEASCRPKASARMSNCVSSSVIVIIKPTRSCFSLRFIAVPPCPVSAVEHIIVVIDCWPEFRGPCRSPAFRCL